MNKIAAIFDKRRGEEMTEAAKQAEWKEQLEEQAEQAELDAAWEDLCTVVKSAKEAGVTLEQLHATVTNTYARAARSKSCN